MAISVEIMLKNHPIVLHDSVYSVEHGSVITFEMLKFYLSNFQLWQNDSAVYTELNSVHLVDVSDTASQKIMLHPTPGLRFNKVICNLGIDSVTNVSGAMGGDLDSTKGMYWTWQSGYVNVKMEGTCTACYPTKNDFEFHLGGYQNPYHSVQTLEWKTTAKSNFNLILDLDQFFTEVDLTKQKHIMSPGADAAHLSLQLAKWFSLK